MVKFINKTTGTEMLVANDRVEEYKAAGHRLAADLGTKPRRSEPKVEEEEVEVVETKRTAGRGKR